jgi:hypothetical protein
MEAVLTELPDARGKPDKERDPIRAPVGATLGHTCITKQHCLGDSMSLLSKGPAARANFNQATAFGRLGEVQEGSQVPKAAEAESWAQELSEVESIASMLCEIV